MPHDTMESLVQGVDSLEMSCSSVGKAEYKSTSAPPSSRPPHHPSTKQYRYGGSSSGSHSLPKEHSVPKDRIMKTIYAPSGSMVVSKRSYKTAHLVMRKDGDNSGLDDGKEKVQSTGVGDIGKGGDNAGKKVMRPERNDNIEQPVDEAKISDSKGGVVEPVSFDSLPAKETVQVHPKLGTGFCPSPQGSFYSATQYAEAKESFTNTEVSECASSVGKSGESGEVSNSCDFVESRKPSIYRESTGSDVSDESSSSSFSSAMYKPHKANDTRWEAIQAVRSRNSGSLELKNFRIFKRLGCGDIGSVHLAELIGTRTLFAMKVMDKEALASRKKILRAQTEREILGSLDHPFLPTLYTHFETEKFSFLVMEFCPGGDLHALRQKQPGKFFPEHAAR